MNFARLTIALLFPLNLLAQAHSAIEKFDTDSLQRLIPHKHGAELADVYNQLATSYSYDDPALCEEYANRALSLAGELDYKKGAGDAERCLGLKHFYAGNYPRSVIHFYNALEYYEQDGDPYYLAKINFDFAKLHFYAGDYAKAEEYGNRFMNMLLQKKSDGTTTGTPREISRAISAFGLLYRSTNRSEQAKEIYRGYCKVMVEENYEITDQMVHTQLLAGCFEETGEHDSALWYLNKTLEFPEVNNSIRALKMESLRLMGDIYYRLGNYREAMMNFEQVARVMEKAGYLHHAFESHIMIGEICFNEEKTDQAEYYFRKALALSNEMLNRKSCYRYDSLKYTVSDGAELYFPWSQSTITTRIWAYQSVVSEKLFNVCRERGDWKQAVTYLLQSSRAKDTLSVLRRHRDLIEMQTKYETGRKEQQIEQLAGKNRYNELRLNQSRIYMIGLGIMMTLLIFIGILLIRQNKIKTKQKTVILEQKLLRSQMNPHFIFNSMASIQDFILANDTRSAANYLSRFARLIRNILDASLDETIPVTKEIETIGNYLRLQKVRLEEKFDFILTGEDAFDDDGPGIPALLIQPFVENAIEHGIRHKEGKGLIRVAFSQNGGWLTVTVEDDGVGRAKAREFEGFGKRDHTSVSTYLIRERLKILNRRSRRKITLDIVDLTDDSGAPAGTSVVIRVPV